MRIHNIAVRKSGDDWTIDFEFDDDTEINMFVPIEPQTDEELKAAFLDVIKNYF